MARRWRSSSLVASLFALFLCGLAAPAHAEPTPVPPGEDAWDFGSTNAVTPDGQVYNGPTMSTNTWLSYLEAGGVLDIRLLVNTTSATALPPTLAAVTLEVVSPSGAIVHSAAHTRDELLGSQQIVERGIGAGEEGIYEVRLDTLSTTGATDTIRARFSRWDIVPRNADGTAHTGRVWAELYRLDSSVAATWDQTFWFVSDSGTMYRMIERATNGITATVRANSAGVMDAATCEPIYQSVNIADLVPNGWTVDPTDCENVFPYEIFFEEPDPTLPERGQRVTGEDWVLPQYAAPATNLNYEQTSPVPQYGGNFTVTLEGQPGNVEVQIDTDGNGLYTDPVDVVLSQTVAVGEHQFRWDGLDGAGNSVPLTRAINARAELAVAGEIHFLAGDVEARVEGIEVEALNGPSVGTFPLSWDDSHMGDGCMSLGVLQPCVSPVPPQLVGEEVDSQGGVHEWGSSSALSGAIWGNDRYIDDWTFTAGVHSPVLALDAAVALDKTAPALVERGTTTTHSWTVTNTGNVALIDQTLTDDVTEIFNVGSIDPATVATTAGDVRFDDAPAEIELTVTLQPGESATVTYEISIDQDATAWATFTDTVEANGWNVTDSVTQAVMVATIDLQKSADPSQLSDPPRIGDVVTYTFTVTNDTQVDLHDVLILDPLPGLSDIVIEWPGEPGILAVGESAEGIASVTITAANLDATFLSNTATVTALTPIHTAVTDEASTSVVLTQVPAIELTKTANDSGVGIPAVAGDEITYSFVVENTGNVTLTDVEIIDPLPELGPVEMQWPDEDGILAVGESATGTATLPVTTAHIDAGRVTNTATARATGAGGRPVSSPPQSTTVVLEQAAALVLTKIADDEALPEMPLPGDDLTYRFSITNAGNVTLTDVSVIDLLPGLSDVDLDFPAVVGVLSPGESATGTATLPLTQTHLNSGKITNTAHAEAVTPDNTGVVSGNVEASAVLPQLLSLRLEKTPDVSQLGNPILPGDIVGYEFVVVNTGNVTLTGVVIADELPGLSPITITWPAVSGILAAGEQATGFAEIRLTEDMILAGQLMNQAVATATAISGEAVESDRAEVTLALEPMSDLVLTKTADSSELSVPARVGERISYSFTVANAGNVTLSDVHVSDTLPGLSELTYRWPGEPGYLSPGQTVIATASLTLAATDLAAGRVTNSATASGKRGDGVIVHSAPSAVAVTLEFGLPTTGVSSPATLTGIAALALMLGLLLRARRRQ